MTVLLIAGIGVILAGLAAIGFGVPVKEFGFGNTLILTGAVGVCTGLIIVSLGLVVREMRKLAEQVGSAVPVAAPPLPRRELKLPPLPERETDEEEAVAAAPPPPVRDVPPAGPELGVPPWQDEMLRDRERLAAAASGEAEEPKRRNLLFSSTRREREKGQAEAAVAQALQLDLDEPDTARESVRAEPLGFEESWPRNERAQPDRPRFSDAIRQAARASATQGDRIADRTGERPNGLPDASQIPDRDEPAPVVPAPPADVTVLKRGVVDGMAYALYSDGSIEAQMPEGVMRFASIDELREHLDNRG